MSLRYQINLRVFFAALCVLFLGSWMAIWQARSAVKEEVESSITLAVQLITVGFAQMPASMQNDVDWLSKLQTLKATRHLNIQVQQPSGQLFSIGQRQLPAATEDLPPQWFIHLVVGEYTQVEHTVIGLNNQPLKVIIDANPLDEITEVWQESLGFFSSLLLLTLFIFLAVNLVFVKVLRSITVIVNALKLIETGHYQQKLPEFAIQEYDSIARAINHMTGELHHSQLENRALTQHSLLIQEEERQRLSQELHDELGQSLTAIKVMAVTAAHAKADLKQATGNIVSICDHLMTVVRSMMQQLHPLILSELGLKAALEDLLQHWAQRYPELQLSMECPDAVDSVASKISIQIFRVVQECLTNIIRHAGARHAYISLSIKTTETPGRLLLAVSDDGCGCIPAQLKSGFGLASMRERIISLDGIFSMQSMPGQGMQILASIPL